MRPALVVVGLTFLAAATAVGAEKPIPQDKARLEKRRADRLEWHRKTLRGSYDKAGKKDPRWDKAAGEALDLAARMFSSQVEPSIKPADVHAAAKKAVDAGCDDPLIQYLFARTSYGVESKNLRDYNRRVQAAAVLLASSQHSPYRRAVASRWAVEAKTSDAATKPEDRPKLQKELDAIIDLIPRSLIEDPRTYDWEDVWYREINSLIAAHRQIEGDDQKAFDRVDARLAKIKQVEPLRLAVKGKYLVGSGWEARTSQVAAKVTEEQFRSFGNKLIQSREALTKAWKLNHDQPHVAETMLIVEKGIGQGDRAAMETWFDRAITLDGDDQQACWSKLDWLDPKWYGSFEDMMDFGKACAETKNWRTGITLLLADAHMRVWQRIPQGEKVNYMRNPEVWNDIRTVFEDYLKHVPDDDAQRSKFAAICYLGAHYPMANAQFQALGDRLRTWGGIPKMPMERVKRIREHTENILSKQAKKPGA